MYVFGVCMCVWKISLSFASVARLLLSLSPPPWGPCVVLGAPAAAPGQLDSQFSSTADVVVALPATLAVCCSPTGRTTTAPSPQLEGNQIQFMAERAREFILVVVVVVTATSAALLLLLMLRVRYFCLHFCISISLRYARAAVKNLQRGKRREE